jgi:ABC-type Na+ efflux pump permease subunit
VAANDDFDQLWESGEPLTIDGYVAWTNRAKASQLKHEFEAQIEELMGRPVAVNIEGNTVYPPADSGLWLLMVTLLPVSVIFMMGISLVPALLFEEKQTKTMAALLVAPANINQVISGKALAGLFYVMVAAGVLFITNWSGVVHWQLVPLFVLGIGLFSTAVGLLLGSFFERQQDVAGLTMLLILLFIGAIFIEMLNMEIPPLLQTMLPWVPSVGLGKIIQFVFLENVPWGEVWLNLGWVLLISAALYMAVTWKSRQLDR